MGSNSIVLWRPLAYHCLLYGDVIIVDITESSDGTADVITSFAVTEDAYLKMDPITV